MREIRQELRPPSPHARRRRLYNVSSAMIHTSKAYLDPKQKCRESLDQ